MGSNGWPSGCGLATLGSRPNSVTAGHLRAESPYPRNLRIAAAQLGPLHRAEHELRLRGSARKFVLDATREDAIAAGGMRVEVARPHYEEVLREEAPDAVVGDVFSVDLALPLALKRREPSWKHVRLFWLVHPYSPQRMQRELAKLPAGEVEAVAGGLPAVAELLLG